MKSAIKIYGKKIERLRVCSVIFSEERKKVNGEEDTLEQNEEFFFKKLNVSYRN